MRRLLGFGLAFVLAAAAGVWLRPATADTASPDAGAAVSFGRPRSMVLAAVGDTNSPGASRRSSKAGAVASSIWAAKPRAVLHLGDQQYEYGSCERLVRYFDRTGWGALMPRVIGAAGPTHDWTRYSDRSNYRRHLAGTCPGQTSGKSLSSKAWGSDVGPQTSHYVDLGKWRVYSLSSGLWRYNQAAARRATTWLNRALATGRAAGDHPIVMWHEPYWTSVTADHGPATATKPWVKLLDKFNVRILLCGHQHGYERFYPQTARGTRNDATGTQAFTVGSGGIAYAEFGKKKAHDSAVRQGHTHGWLKLRLWPNGHYSWKFIRTGGQRFSDGGHR
jgi:hypothetical protein